MPGKTETAPRKFVFPVPHEQNVAVWRALLGLDSGVGVGLGWTLNGEVRSNTMRDRSERPLIGANADVWKRLSAVGGDSAAIANARLQPAHATGAPPTVAEYLAWLDSEDFGTDPDRVRREAWH
jgi:hypothetical protein